METSIQTSHLTFCFESIICHLNKKKLPKFPESLKDEKYPLFVTWHKGPEKELRGCIGTFAHNPISKNLQKYALISAFQDDRFEPISKTELPHLHLSISFLFDYQENKKWDEWEIGVHGIIIEFEHKGSVRSGTFLPEVAKEQNWDKNETLKYLTRKAGFYGNYLDILDKINLTTYRSLKGSMSYDEYLQNNSK
jgi:uncharacterized protein (TIGR00296 family)